MQITHRMNQSVCIMTLDGTLEWTEINGIREYLLQSLEEQEISSVLVNCENLKGLESKGGVLVTSLYQTLVEEEKALGLCNLSPQDREGLKTFNLDQMVQLFDNEAEALTHLTESLSAFTENDLETPYHPILKASVEYFQGLEQNILEQNKLEASDDHSHTVEGSDGFVFDVESVQEALIMCEQLQIFLSDLSPEKFKLLQKTFPFYKTPERMLDKLKVNFMGDLEVKEKIIRVYTAKAYGTFKVVTFILTTPEIFEGMDDGRVKTIQQALLAYGQGTFKTIKELLPVKVRSKMKWTARTLVPNIKRIMGQGTPLFAGVSDYQSSVKRFREIIFNAFASPYLELYLTWKNNYLKHWVLEELFQEDVEQLKHAKKQIPLYMPVKLNIYQNLSATFSTLEFEDQAFQNDFLLKKTELSTLQMGEAYNEESGSPMRAKLERSRQSEKALLSSLSFNQMAAVAEQVHREVATLHREQPEEELQTPPLNTRSTDIASEQQAEQIYSDKTIAIQAEYSQKIIGAAEKILGALKNLKHRLHSGHKAQETEEESVEVLAIPDRTPGIKQPLRPVDVDWASFGREFKSTIYEFKIPNQQKFFFDNSGLKIALFLQYQECVDDMMDYYGGLGYVGELGYLKKTILKVGMKVKGQNTIKQFVDEAIFLRTEKDTVLVLGKAPFSKTASPTHYFQVYRPDVETPYRGSTHSCDFSRVIDGTKYDLENFEKSVVMRPLLFQSLIHAIDSLPDEIRIGHARFLISLHNFLDEQENPKDRRV